MRCAALTTALLREGVASSATRFFRSDGFLGNIRTLFLLFFVSRILRHRVMRKRRKNM
ncbi:hypothetical protein TSAR_000623 [Trichomalopsis sarcophagae]|uniref:Uncharacterized protein n=1 Tax=Trichomalopsis sarcophagae TaxID=543379 RepID=A0A232EW60_9HYME|nr:hypothetical protein TSAR_000623 [Trichomalopsis sarcophagae]